MGVFSPQDLACLSLSRGKRTGCFRLSNLWPLGTSRCPPSGDCSSFAMPCETGQLFSRGHIWPYHPLPSGPASLTYS